MKPLKTILILALVAGVSYYGWHKVHHVDEANIEPAAGGMPTGPVPVSVATLKEQPLQQWLQFSGRLVAVDTVEVRPRVNGAIQTVYFQPGEIVEKNAPLFLIDPRPYEAAVNQGKAAVAAAQAQNALTQSDLERAQRLIGENAISRRDVDTRQNASRVANAALQGAKATLEQAELNLNYATVRAPVRGRISRAEVTVGNMVNAANAPVLATIVSVDSIYADFEVDEQTYITMIRQKNQPHNGKGNNEASLPVQLVLASDDRAGDEPAMSYPGQIVSFDNKLDPASGTIRARAIFDNKDKALVPGMFANIRLGQASAPEGIAIPDRLIGTDQDKKYVYVVANGKVTYRPVTLGGLSQGLRIITAGLKAGDQIITDGLQKIRPDMPVQPHEAPLAASVETADKAQTPAEPAEKTDAQPEALEPAADKHMTTSEAMPEPIAPVDQKPEIKPSQSDAKADDADTE